MNNEYWLLSLVLNYFSESLLLYKKILILIYKLFSSDIFLSVNDKIASNSIVAKLIIKLLLPYLSNLTDKFYEMANG